MSNITLRVFRVGEVACLPLRKVMKSENDKERLYSDLWSRKHFDTQYHKPNYMLSGEVTLG